MYISNKHLVNDARLFLIPEHMREVWESSWRRIYVVSVLFSFLFFFRIIYEVSSVSAPLRGDIASSDCTVR